MRNDKKNRFITEYDESKALRILCNHARQVGRLLAYVSAYRNGEPVPPVSMREETLYDELADEYGIRLRAELRSRYDREKVRSCHEHITMEEVPPYLKIEANDNLEDVCEMLSKVKNDAYMLKDQALYVAMNNGEITYNYERLDNDIYWIAVAWGGHHFLMPASAERSKKRYASDVAYIPASAIFQGYTEAKSDAGSARVIVEMYIEENAEQLAGFDQWLQSRDPVFVAEKIDRSTTGHA